MYLFITITMKNTIPIVQSTVLNCTRYDSNGALYMITRLKILKSANVYIILENYFLHNLNI